MKIVKIKCPVCGAELKKIDDIPIVECSLCKSRYEINEEKNEIKILNGATFEDEIDRDIICKKQINNNRMIYIVIITVLLVICVMEFIILKKSNLNNELATTENENTIVENDKESENIINDNKESDIIKIDKKNMYPYLYENGDTYVAVESCEYTQDASNITILLDVCNAESQIIKLSFENIKVNDVSIRMIWDSNEYEVGQCISAYYIDLEKLQAADLSDFSEIVCDMIIQMNDGTVLTKKTLKFEREVFQDAQ